MKYMKNIYAINVFMVFLFYSIAYPTIKFVNLPLFANSTTGLLAKSGKGIIMQNNLFKISFIPAYY